MPLTDTIQKACKVGSILRGCKLALDGDAPFAAGDEGAIATTLGTAEEALGEVIASLEAQEAADAPVVQPLVKPDAANDLGEELKQLRGLFVTLCTLQATNTETPIPAGTEVSLFYAIERALDDADAMLEAHSSVPLT